MTDAWMPGAERVPAPADGGGMKGGTPRAVWLMLPGDPRWRTARYAAERLIRFGRPCHLVWNPLSGELVQLIPVVRAARTLSWPPLEPGRPAELAAADPGWPGPSGPRLPGPRLPGSCPAGSGLPAQRGPADREPGPPASRPPGWRPPAGPVAPPARDGLPGVNNEGRVCVQIGVIGHHWDPFTNGPALRLPDIISWLDTWQVPRRWPAGRPSEGLSAPGPQSRRVWARGGHFASSQVPGSACAGTGAIDIDQLTGAPLLQLATTPAAGAAAGAAPGAGTAADRAAATAGGIAHGPARISARTWQPRRTPARSAAP